MHENEGFITPDLQGKLAKKTDEWLVTVPFPTIPFAEVTDSGDVELVNGKSVLYDLKTTQDSEGNKYHAVNLRNLVNTQRLKMTPKQRDRQRRTVNK